MNSWLFRMSLILPSNVSISSTVAGTKTSNFPSLWETNVSVKKAPWIRMLCLLLHSFQLWHRTPQTLSICSNLMSHSLTTTSDSTTTNSTAVTPRYTPWIYGCNCAPIKFHLLNIKQQAREVVSIGKGFVMQAWGHEFHLQRTLQSPG